MGPTSRDRRTRLCLSPRPSTQPSRCAVADGMAKSGKKGKRAGASRRARCLAFPGSWLSQAARSNVPGHRGTGSPEGGQTHGRKMTGRRGAAGRASPAGGTPLPSGQGPFLPVPPAKVPLSRPQRGTGWDEALPNDYRRGSPPPPRPRHRGAEQRQHLAAPEPPPAGGTGRGAAAERHQAAVGCRARPRSAPAPTPPRPPRGVRCRGAGSAPVRRPLGAAERSGAEPRRRRRQR